MGKNRILLSISACPDFRFDLLLRIYRLLHRSVAVDIPPNLCRDILAEYDIHGFYELIISRGVSFSKIEAESFKLFGIIFDLNDRSFIIV